MRHGLWLLALMGLALASPPRAQSSTVYDTTGAWDGATFISSFGVPDTATYGQTFLAPVADNVLEDFTFFIRGNTAVHLEMKGMVFNWSGSLLGGGGGMATGAPLFTRLCQKTAICR